MYVTRESGSPVVPLATNMRSAYVHCSSYCFAAICDRRSIPPLLEGCCCNDTVIIAVVTASMRLKNSRYMVIELPISSLSVTWRISLPEPQIMPDYVRSRL